MMKQKYKNVKIFLGLNFGNHVYNEYKKADRLMIDEDILRITLKKISQEYALKAT